jgi:hypothetical protein
MHHPYSWLLGIYRTKMERQRRFTVNLLLLSNTHCSCLGKGHWLWYYWEVMGWWHEVRSLWACSWKGYWLGSSLLPFASGLQDVSSSASHPFSQYLLPHHKSWCNMYWYVTPLGGRSSHIQSPVDTLWKQGQFLGWKCRQHGTHRQNVENWDVVLFHPPRWDQMLTLFLRRPKSRLSCEFTLFNVDSWLKYFYFMQMRLVGNWTIISPSNLRSHFILQVSMGQELTVTMQETVNLFSLPCIMRTQKHLYTGNFWLYI